MQISYLPKSPQQTLTASLHLLAGCPISQEIGIDSSIRTVFGEGAQSGTLNQPTSFFVDTQGRTGDLFIHIQGYECLQINHKSINHNSIQF